MNDVLNSTDRAFSYGGGGEWDGTAIHRDPFLFNGLLSCLMRLRVIQSTVAVNRRFVLHV